MSVGGRRRVLLNDGSASVNDVGNVATRCCSVTMPPARPLPEAAWEVATTWGQLCHHCSRRAAAKLEAYCVSGTPGGHLLTPLGLEPRAELTYGG